MPRVASHVKDIVSNKGACTLRPEYVNAAVYIFFKKGILIVEF